MLRGKQMPMPPWLQQVGVAAGQEELAVQVTSPLLHAIGSLLETQLEVI